MKNEYMEVFKAAVRAKVERANAAGMKTTWSTKDHLDTLAKVLEAHPQAIREVLGECYNVSQFQQSLAGAFEQSGHFQRQTVKGKLGSVVSELEKLAGAVAPKVEAGA